MLMTDQRYGLDRKVRLAAPLALDSGAVLVGVDVAYETYGSLNEDASNAVLICHALTGDQHVAASHPRTGKPGWWTRLVGEGKPVDPARALHHLLERARRLHGIDRAPRASIPRPASPMRCAFLVINADPRHGARAGGAVLDHLGVRVLHAVVGGSMGGMQALEWAVNYPDRVRSVVAVATAARHSAQNIAFHEVSGARRSWPTPTGRAGITMAALRPAPRLAVARMAAPHHLSVGGGADREGARPSAAIARGAELRVRCRLPGRTNSYLRPPGAQLRRAVRRQLLPLYHPRHRLFRHGRGA